METSSEMKSQFEKFREETRSQFEKFRQRLKLLAFLLGVETLEKEKAFSFSRIVSIFRLKLPIFRKESRSKFSILPELFKTEISFRYETFNPKALGPKNLQLVNGACWQSDSDLPKTQGEISFLWNDART